MCDVAAVYYLDHGFYGDLLGLRQCASFSRAPFQTCVGHAVTFDNAILGFPRASLSDLEDGTYFVQAELFVYDLYSRVGLPQVWMPASCVSSAGANGEYAKPDGTLLSSVEEVEFTQAMDLALTLDRVTPPAQSPGCAGLGDGINSDWIKTVRVSSSLLGAFWQREITLEACVLVPLGWNTSGAEFPLVVAHGHYSPIFFSGGGFSETDPECDADKDGYACVQDQYNYYLYNNWTSTDPEVLKIGP